MTSDSSSSPTGAMVFLASSNMFLVFLGISVFQFHSYLFETKGFVAFELGLLLLIGHAAAIFSPAVQFFFVRRTGGPMIPLAALFLSSSLSTAAFPFLSSFLALSICSFVFTFSISGLIPLNTAYVLNLTRDLGHANYFRFRSLGTIGFLFGCIGATMWARRFPLEKIYLGFALVFGCGFLLVFSKLFGPHRVMQTHSTTTPLRKVFEQFGRPATLKLLLILSAMAFANQMTIGVQGNHLINSLKGGVETISIAWAVSTFFEIPIMLLCSFLFRISGLKWVFLVGFLGTMVKLVGLSLSNTLGWYYFFLIFHGFYYGGVVVGFGVYIDRTYPAESRAMLQSFAAIFINGIPAALAGLFSGLIWKYVSLPAVIWSSALLSIGVFVLAVAFVFSLERANRL